jgi:exoribonuclease R
MKQIDQAEIMRRRDMREVLTFTIDPADAKDFDDALSFAEQEDGTLQVGVHIADVTHYVKPGSQVDNEAYERGTSTYLVDRVLPMLPEELCNDLCSLRPHEDKLCMSVIFSMKPDATVLKHKLCRTVIRSDARLNYDQAQSIIVESQKVPAGTPINVESPVAHAILRLNEMALRMRAARLAKGALAVEQDEMRFILDETGHPREIYFEHPNEAHHLIEEFMLLANRTVAEAVGSRPFVYRVHDKPNEEKLADLADFKHRMGDKALPSIVEMLTIRAMSKAVYSTKNIGHYGLRFDYYTHFTSPIRRYPDMIVHRLVSKYILTGKGDTWQQEVLENMCVHLSDMEQLAQQAERDSIKHFQALWMQDHMGEELDGHISGVTEFGLFVQLDESRCEGLVHVAKICPGDYMMLDEKNYRLIAAESGTTFTLGDAVRVRVVKADAEKNQIDFELVESR